MKRGAGKSKGSAFEREVCVALSKWWTYGERDDVFWRSTISGGRATQRAKAGKRTEGQYGDVQAVGKIGKPLTDLFTIEVKRGYKNASFGDLLDLRPGKKTPWHDWIEQAARAAEQARSASWMLIVKRDFRQTVLVTPVEIFVGLCSLSSLRPCFRFIIGEGAHTLVLWAVRFNDFLGVVRPAEVLQAMKQGEDCS